MTDIFHSCEITPIGISIKVGTHRRAIGVGDYNTKAEFITAVSALLKDVLGNNLALVAANVAAAETDASAKIAELQAAHDAEKAALQADLDALGTKEEAQAIRKQQERTKKLELVAKLTAELRADQHDDLEPVDLKP